MRRLSRRAAICGFALLAAVATLTTVPRSFAADNLPLAIKGL